MTLKNITFSTWLTAVMLLIFTTMVLLSLGYPAKARFMPLIVGIPGIALCLVQLAVDLLRTPEPPQPSFVHVPAAAVIGIEHVEAELPEFGPHTVKLELVMWAYFISFIAGILAFGFYLSVPVMLVTFLRTQAKASWIFSAALAAAATIVLYLLFGRLLHIELHPGFVTPWIINKLGLPMI